MEQILQHIADEQEIKDFHAWISQLCHPDSPVANVQHFDQIQSDHQAKLESLRANRKDNLSLTSTNQEHAGSGQRILRALANKFNCYSDTQEVFDKKFRIRGDNDTLFEGTVDKNGQPHGFYRVITPDGEVEFFGCFINGQLIGNCWKSLIGGSFMASDQCDFSGNNTIYFYPDCRTAIIGTFGPNGQLKKGHVTEIIGVDLDPAKNPEPVFLAPDTQEGPEYFYDVSSNVCISKQPTLPDPYEELFVYVDASLIPYAGEGLFAKLDIEASTVIAFYNGTRFKIDDPKNRLDSPFKINFNEDYDLDIPDDMTSTSNYKASLGHKVCHSFTPNCEFDNFEHPRFGDIKCIVTLRPIEQGEEITVNYEYDLAVAPPWYKKLWAKHQKSLRGLPNWKLALAFKERPFLLSSNSNSTTSSSSPRSLSECFSPEKEDTNREAVSELAVI